MTLLSLAQDILKETKNSTIPSTIIGNNQDAARQALEALTLAVTDVGRAFNWQELQKEHTFSSVASQENYALPTDYDRLIDNTFWNSTKYRVVIGPTSERDWRILKNSTISGATANDYFRVRADEFLIFPTPTAVESFVVEYISNNVVEDSGGTGQTGWEADTDVPVVDEYLVRLNATWRLLNNQGRPYAEKLASYERALQERIDRNGGNQTVYHQPIQGIDKSRIGYPTLITAP